MQNHLSGLTIGWFGIGLLLGLAGSSQAAVLKYNDVSLTQSDKWTSGNDGQSTATVKLSTTAPGAANTVLELDYTISNSWVSFTSPTFGNTINLKQYGNAFTYYMRNINVGSTAPNVIMEVGGQRSGTVTATNMPDWQKITVPFYSFSGVDFTKVSKVGFTIDPNNTAKIGGQTGQLLFDQLMVTTVVESTSNTAAMVVDDGSGGAGTNSLGSNVLVSSNPPTGVVNLTVGNSNPTPFKGVNFRQITTLDYSGWGGMYERLSWANSPTNYAVDGTKFTHMAFYVYATSTVYDDIKVELKDKVNGGSVSRIQNFIEGNSLTGNTWNTCRIPLTQFPTVTLSQLWEMTILPPKNCTVFIDYISFINVTGTATAGDYLLDSMDTFYSNSSWETVDNENSNKVKATIELSSWTGLVKYALGVKYAFPTSIEGMWGVNAYRSFGMNIQEENSNAFQFKYYGTSSSGTSVPKNRIEFKVYDTNTVAYWRVFSNVTDTNGVWKTMTLPFKDLAPMSTRPAFDYRNVKKIELAFSKGDGGTGIVYIDTLEYLKAADFSTNLPVDRLVNDFKIDNNPFQPQTNAISSKATFSYSLTDTAKVSLKIFDLSGREIIRIDRGTLVRGDYSLVWDGLDKHGTAVRNGLYLFQLVAEGKSATQKISNVIGVTR